MNDRSERIVEQTVHYLISQCSSMSRQDYIDTLKEVISEIRVYIDAAKHEQAEEEAGADDE